MKKVMLTLTSLLLLFVTKVKSLEVEPEHLTFTSEPESKSFNITSNSDWSIDNNVKWININKTDGSGDANITVDADTMNSDINRMGGLKISNKDTNINVEVHQLYADVAIPAKIEAENFEVNKGVTIDSSDNLSGEAKVIDIDKKDWIEYPIYIKDAKTYDFNLVTSGQSGEIEIIIDGNSSKTVNIPSNSKWDTVATSIDLSGLSAGEHIFQFYITEGGFELDCFAFQSQSKNISRIGYNHQELFLNGANYPWDKFAHDIGPGSTNFSKFKEIFSKLNKHGANSVRFWLHTNGANTPSFDSDGKVNSPGTGTIKDLRKILDLAYKNGVGMVLSLWSFDMLSSDYGSDIVDRNKDMLTKNTYMEAYIDNALIPMVDSLQGHPAIIAWEIFNEPEGMSESFGFDNRVDPSDQIPMSDIQTFINKCAGAIHRTDSTIPVTNGAWSFKSMTDVDGHKNYYTDQRLKDKGGDEDGYLDFYQVHYYEWAGTEKSPFHHDYSYWELNKPLIVGEFHPEETYGVEASNLHNKLYNRGYAGALSWSYDQDKYNDIIEENTQYVKNNYWYDNDLNTPYFEKPLVSIVSPDDGATFSKGADVNITAEVSNFENNLEKIEFYQGDSLLGSTSDSPWEHTWKNVSDGRYDLTAIGEDIKGNKIKSEIVTIVVESEGGIDSLASHWTFDEGSGTVAENSANSIDKGQIYGANWTEGKYNQALEFDGEDDYVGVPDSKYLDFKDSLTVTAWVKVQDTSGKQEVLQKGTNYGIFELRPDERYLSNVFNDGSNWQRVWYTVTKDYFKGEWHHIAFSYDGEEAVNYLDGEKDSSLTISASMETNDDSLSIGNNAPWNVCHFNGKIDDVRLYNVALNETEINNIYNGKPPSDIYDQGQNIDKFTLGNNYPNPFNPSTTIDYTLPKNQKVKLTIYNLKGQKIKTLTNAVQSTGKHKVVWRGRNQNGKKVSSGIYFYRLQTDNNVSVKKMVLIK